MELIRDLYENGECPDCGEEIPVDMVDGGECVNCGHVFWATEEPGEQ
jgi:rubredoxin